MKFSIAVPALNLYPPVMGPWEAQACPSDFLRIAHTADGLGYDFLSTSDHIVMPPEVAEVLGPRYPETLSAAAFLAGATSRIRVFTHVLVLPYRNPVVLAKGVSTLDFLSGGRITLGIGAGHMEQEFAVLNVPHNQRGPMTDEYIRAMKELWTSDRPSFQGNYVRFDGIVFEPKPLQKPHPPIVVGGNSRPAMRRAASLGDGWVPWLITAQQLPACLSYIHEQPAFRERTRPFDVFMPLASQQAHDYVQRKVGEAYTPAGRDETVERIGVLKEAGATGILANLPCTSTVDEYLERLKWFAQEIIPLFRD
jgi:probable F420-dependent oxidoreductase